MIAVVFGQPSAGRLLRDVRHGAGTPDDGARYYTNAASDGTYHVSTLHYLPPAGFSSQVTIPMTLLTQQGQEWEDTLTVAVTSKTHSHQFTDVNEATVGTWAANAVDFAYHFGLVNGTGEDTFSPSSNMTRAQLVTVLYRAVGSPTMTITTNFEDLDVGAYYYSAVVWANFHGIVNGTSDTTFSPPMISSPGSSWLPSSTAMPGPTAGTCPTPGTSAPSPTRTWSANTPGRP